MKKSTKLIATVVCMVVVIAAMVVGIYAASNNISGSFTVSFSATEVNAQVQGEILGQGSGGSNLSLTSLNAAGIDWNPTAFTITNVATPVTIRIGVKNNSSENIIVTLGTLTGSLITTTNSNYCTLTYKSSNTTSTFSAPSGDASATNPSAVTVASGKWAVFDVILTLNNNTSSISNATLALPVTVATA